MPRVIRAEADVFKQQPDGWLIKAEPDDNTLYPVLEAKKNVRIIGAVVKCIWSVEPIAVELVMIVDGKTYVFIKNSPATDTWYGAIEIDVSDALDTQMDITVMTKQAFLVEGRLVMVDMRVLGGTVSNLSGRVKWGQIA